MRYDWDRLPNTLNVCLELSEFPEALFLGNNAALLPFRCSVDQAIVDVVIALAKNWRIRDRNETNRHASPEEQVRKLPKLLGEVKMSQWYPLRFQPLFRRYLWGGRRLETVLRKPIGEGEDYAESWEIVDHGDDQTIVAAGHQEGKSLGEIVRENGDSLFGRHHPQKQFPLLFKFLDANRDLSVQVHPNDKQGSKQTPPDLGKTEAWVIMHADPGSCVYAGMKEGVDRETLQKEIDNGTTENCLHRFEPEVGDCIFIPAGTVHALGAGLVVAEIQQSSDTTFRLFDWNRVGADGLPRQLHIEQGLNVIDYQKGPVNAVQPQATAADHIQRLVECDKFVLDRWSFDGEHSIGGDDRCHVLAVLEGSATLDGDPLGRPIEKGHTVLLPAAAGAVGIVANEKTVLLDAYLPG